MYVYVTGIDDGDDLDPDLLAGIYERIKGQEFRPGVDQVTQVMKVEQTIVGKKPVSAPIDIRQSLCTCMCVCFMRACMFCVNDVCVLCMVQAVRSVCMFRVFVYKADIILRKETSSTGQLLHRDETWGHLPPACLPFFFFPSHTHVRVGCLHQSRGGCL